MLDDLVPNLPSLDSLQDDGGAQGGDLTIRTMNSNMGAIRVQVVRDLRKVRMSVAQLADMFGDAFEYKLPFRKRDRETGKTTTEIVAGPSIRCTTAVARAYGNCSVDCQAEETAAAYLFEAAFLDVETGFRLSRPFRQRKDQNVGGMGGDAGRVQDVIFQIGASKATRNVIRNALPDLCEYAVERARGSLIDRIKKNRQAVLEKVRERLSENRIPLARVETYYGAKLDEMNERVLAQLVGLLQAVRDGMCKPSEVCPEGEAAPESGQPVPERDEGDEPRDETPRQPAQEARQTPAADQSASAPSDGSLPLDAPKEAAGSTIPITWPEAKSAIYLSPENAKAAFRMKAETKSPKWREECLAANPELARLVEARQP